jgi:hypothetical protein
LRDSYGVMVNYRYIPEDLADNHERFTLTGEMAISPALMHERRVSASLWKGETGKAQDSTKKTTADDRR